MARGSFVAHKSIIAVTFDAIEIRVMKAGKAADLLLRTKDKSISR